MQKNTKLQKIVLNVEKSDFSRFLKTQNRNSGTRFMGKTATSVVFYGIFGTIWRKKIVAIFAYPKIGKVYAKKNMIVGWMIFLYETRHTNNEYFKSALPIYFRKIPQENQILFIRWSEKYSINFYHALLTWFVIFTFFSFDAE